MLERVLDLVAVATIADVVPLVDENRGLVRAGLRRLRGGGRPGLDALIAVAHVDRARAGAGEIAFRARAAHQRLRPARPPGGGARAAADGRRAAGAGPGRRLDDLNRERQAVEDAILRDALRRPRSSSPSGATPAAWCCGRTSGTRAWSASWPRGWSSACGGRWCWWRWRARRVAGSGRSLPVYDLHAGLAATSEHLEAYGGHRVAAGVTVRADRLEDFARAFAAHADAALADEDLSPVERIDAVASLADVSLDVADELGRLEPFGLGNPGVSVLLPARRDRRRASDGRRQQAPALRRPLLGRHLPRGHLGRRRATPRRWRGGRFDVVAASSATTGTARRRCSW